ncbi:MAG: deoxynucleoside kinase [Armatimonadetes bacterium]|nr:deoxynucleoside kinase [Armatimonadota bacterium]
MKWFVAMSGNIGSGKSTLTTQLCQRLGWQPYYEVVDENPYLPDFYAGMARWSFHLQVFFLTRRFQHHQEILRAPHSVIQDRTIYEDVEIFARNLYLQGLMDERDFRTYHDLFHLMLEFLRPPDLIIYLRAPVDLLLDRIRARSRDFERAIPPAYLAQLNERYEEWIARFILCPVLVLDAASVHLDNLETVIEAMQQRLSSLFPLKEIPS